MESTKWGKLQLLPSYNFSHINMDELANWQNDNSDKAKTAIRIIGGIPKEEMGRCRSDVRRLDKH